MRAMVLERAATPSTAASLRALQVAQPVAASGELLVRVSVCGVCRTDLDLVDGRLLPPSYPVVPGHQVVGRVAAIGANVSGFREGDRVGIAWIHWACGVCAWCRAGTENLCPFFRSTGCDTNGGYAEYTTVPAAFAHHVPDALGDVDAAPWLCAGAIGWRSLRLTGLENGEPLGLSGFGASAHLVLQLARVTFPASPVFVFARDADDRDFARSLGATWAGEIGERPPDPLRAIIDTTPVWRPILEALRSLAPGGRLVINAIRKEASDREALAQIDYATDLWMEREIKSVANVTRADVREVLTVAAAHAIRPTTTVLPLEQANDALAALRSGGIRRGAQVLRIEPT